MLTVIKLRTEGDIECIPFPEPHDCPDNWYAQMIECEYVERVRCQGLPEPYVLLCDEIGRLKDRPTINFIASYLYGTHMHGEPVVGHCLVVKEVPLPNGIAFSGLEEDEARAMVATLTTVRKLAIKAVKDALGDRIKPMQED